MLSPKIIQRFTTSRNKARWIFIYLTSKILFGLKAFYLLGYFHCNFSSTACGKLMLHTLIHCLWFSLNKSLPYLWAIRNTIPCAVSCPFDWVRVYDGPDNTSAIIGTYCGQQRNLVLYSSDERLLVTFYTLPRAANTQNRGFKGIFEFSESFVKLGEFVTNFRAHMKQQMALLPTRNHWIWIILQQQRPKPRRRQKKLERFL